MAAEIGFSSVPKDALVLTFEFLDLPSLGKAACVCRNWRDSQSNEFWQQIQKDRYPGIPNNPSMSAKEFVILQSINIPLIHSYISAINGLPDNELVGHMNLGRRVIVLTASMYANMYAAANIAIDHPKMPNNSFVVYTYSNRCWPSVNVKSCEGQITKIIDVRDDLDNLVLQNIRAGNMNHFSMVDNQMLQPTYPGYQRALSLIMPLAPAVEVPVAAAAPEPVPVQQPAPPAPQLREGQVIAPELQLLQQCVLL